VGRGGGRPCVPNRLHLTFLHLTCVNLIGGFPAAARARPPPLSLSLFSIPLARVGVYRTVCSPTIVHQLLIIWRARACRLGCSLN